MTKTKSTKVVRKLTLSKEQIRPLLTTNQQTQMGRTLHGPNCPIHTC